MGSYGGGKVFRGKVDDCPQAYRYQRACELISMIRTVSIPYSGVATGLRYGEMRLLLAYSSGPGGIIT